MKHVAIMFLKLYKKTLSKLIGKECKFSPTCSVYSMEAYSQHGFLKGTFLTFKRVFTCGPWSEGGFDSVPHNYGGNIKWVI